MKKMLILLISLTTGAFVQLNAQMEMKFLKGFKANITTSNVLLKNPDAKSNFGMGYSFGSSEKLEIGKNLALQGELLFHYKTFGIENISMQRTKSDIRCWAMEVPVYAVGQIKTGLRKVFLGIGPYFSYGLSAKSNSGQVNLYRTGGEITGEHPLNRWDFGYGAIFGYEFSNGLFVNAAYHAGIEFANILKTNENNASMKNQSFSFGLGYRFQLLSVKINKNKILWNFF